LTGREPNIFPFERCNTAGVRRDKLKTPRRFAELWTARVRFGKVLINDHNVARAVAVSEFSDQKISARHRGYEAVGRRTFAMSRDFAEMVNVV
jgi:hypothetical protein